jgi:hypothetical protein
VKTGLENHMEGKRKEAEARMRKETDSICQTSGEMLRFLYWR